jgi:group I intron endonuclease
MIIYKITNKINDKSYIGQTIQNLNKRWKNHCYDALKKLDKFKFYNAIRKYGKDCWSLEIIEEVDNEVLLNEREYYWIAYYDTFKNGYNSTSGGERGKLLFSEEVSLDAFDEFPDASNEEFYE